MNRIMKRLAMTVGSAMALTAVACGGGNDNQSASDSNGVFDMTEQTVGQLLAAIRTECADGDAEGGFGAVTVEQCQEVCDCGVRAVADLEGRTTAPELTAACYNACGPDFQGSDDLRLGSFDDDADDEPDYDGFFLVYLVKCDEVAYRLIREDRDSAAECVDTCNCLSDTMEKYISRSSDDAIRATCEDQCSVRTTTSMASFLHGDIGGER